jgi:hypothetical protein
MRVVEMALTSLVILAEVLEGVSLELVDTLSVLHRIECLMRQVEDDVIQEMCLQLGSQLFTSGEVDLAVCSSSIVALATQRLNWLSPSVQLRATALLALVSENSTLIWCPLLFPGLRLASWSQIQQWQLSNPIFRGLPWH